ncbi:MAG: hypothetical protein ACFKPT_01740 [Gloeotrichia echinulata GP01]
MKSLPSIALNWLGIPKVALFEKKSFYPLTTKDSLVIVDECEGERRRSNRTETIKYFESLKKTNPRQKQIVFGEYPKTQDTLEF